ncbi:MAG: hypothetical protein IKY26_05635 [Erysipelotrichaceae bacterium]|nr:hypothetical protein [Erysipelotrichaceae bacterium]
MNEKLYLFNPFNIKEWSNEQVKEQLTMLIDKYETEAFTPYQYALNIENLANQMYLIGEMIARLHEAFYINKAELENEESLQVYKQRDSWEKTHDGKAPAMSYFQALASDFVKEKRLELAKLESDLKRFKIAYDSIEAKMNAVKKKLEAVKYEEFGNQ